MTIYVVHKLTGHIGILDYGTYLASGGTRQTVNATVIADYVGLIEPPQELMMHVTFIDSYLGSENCHPKDLIQVDERTIIDTPLPTEGCKSIW